MHLFGFTQQDRLGPLYLVLSFSRLTPDGFGDMLLIINQQTSEGQIKIASLFLFAISEHNLIIFWWYICDMLKSYISLSKTFLQSVLSVNCHDTSRNTYTRNSVSRTLSLSGFWNFSCTALTLSFSSNFSSRIVLVVSSFTGDFAFFFELDLPKWLQIVWDDLQGLEERNTLQMNSISHCSVLVFLMFLL